MRPLLIVPLVAIATAASGSARATTLIGNDFAGRLYDVDPLTGAASNPRETHLANLCGVTASPTGALYGLTAFSQPGQNSLYRIDGATGAATLVGPTGIAFVLEGDLDFQPGTGALYGTQEAISGVTGSGLFRLNLSTGAATRVGVINGRYDVSALAFASDGTLYALSITHSDPPEPTYLLRLNPSNAAVLQSTTLGINFGRVAGMDFDAGGTLYVADGSFDGTDSLYTLDPATGALALVGHTGLADGLAGLSFVVPEPAAATTPASASAAVALMSHRAGRKRRCRVARVS